MLSLGLKLHGIVCAARDIEIKNIDETNAREFYTIFHYTNATRKGARSFGAFYNDKLVAAISYTYPIRKEISTSLGFNHGEVIEVSRLARITNITCKNLLSRLIGYTRKRLPGTIKCIVSYADSAFGHTGGVYKSSGFECVGEVPPDYYYISLHGKYHKKTIWDYSKKMKMTEKEYADKHGLMRVNGSKKTKWIYMLTAKPI